MNYLLDTHSFIWFSEDNDRLSGNARNTIEDTQHTIYLSLVSLWEIAIKLSLDKLELKKDIDAIIAEIEKSPIQWLHLKPKHIKLLPSLPFHHRDPFDRLIIAQGLEEQMTIITKDDAFRSYDVKVLW